MNKDIQSKKNEKPIDLMSFLSDFKKKDKLAEFIGVTIIFVVSMVIVYIGTWQADYAKQFYSITFKINFLEGVRPGMKIRYQGGVVIGEVQSIESNYRDHYLHTIIKNDFKIIKYGTKISLKEQGSFGSNYINISTVPYYFSGETFEPGDIIEVAQIVPFQDTLNNFYSLFKSEIYSDSVIAKRLKGIKYMLSELIWSKKILPFEVRNLVQTNLNGIQNILIQLQELNTKLFDSVEKMNVSLNNVAITLRHNLPIISNSMQKIYSYLQYSPHLGKEDQFLHDEQLYYSALMRLNIIKDKLREYKDFPYKLIFESGL